VYSTASGKASASPQELWWGARRAKAWDGWHY